MCGGCGYSGGVTYKAMPVYGLESKLASSAYNPQDNSRSYEITYAHSVMQPQLIYKTSTVSSVYKASSSNIDYIVEHPIFLNPDRPSVPFIADAAEIAQFVKEAFLKTTQKELPGSITITVASRKTLQRIHPQFNTPGVVGLSINSTKEVFAVSGSLDEVMLTVGHEIGHVITPLLPDEHAEEAKAFAFEMAWAQAIFLHDIAGLRRSINQAALGMKPASNGLHDLAFAFVKAATILRGTEPFELHTQLSEQKTGFEGEPADFPAAATVTSAPVSYIPLSAATNASYHSGGYLNKSNVQNVPWMQNFTWADLGTGIYGMYFPSTASILMNERLLRTDLEQFHRTLGHEYILHHVMQLPDGYVAKVMEEQIFWTKDEKDEYEP